jgi:hypothetical protein
MRLGSRLLLVLTVAACLVLGLDAGPIRAASQATCTSAEKAQFQAKADAYAKQMLKDRARYFKSHKSDKTRAAFVKKQKAKLKVLRARANCDDSPPPPPPINLNPVPTANETFSFGSGISAAAGDEIKGDIAFAAEDEQRLIGLSLDKVTVFASTDANWLAGQQCTFYDYGGSCQPDIAAFYASGNSAAQGGPGAVFVYWAAPSWRYGAGPNQKIIAHELFHVLQYQTDHLVNAGSTPPDQVRPTGPVWLDEGAPEMIGYHVADDRMLMNYTSALNGQIAATKQIGTPLSGLERLSQTNIPNVYSLFALSVDHLTKIVPGGLPALAAYYRALGAGASWPDAFQQAFGMSVAAYYANFNAYRAGL